MHSEAAMSRKSSAADTSAALHAVRITCANRSTMKEAEGVRERWLDGRHRLFEVRGQIIGSTRSRGRLSSEAWHVHGNLRSIQKSPAQSKPTTGHIRNSF